jgi:hypothetical protein
LFLDYYCVGRMWIHRDFWDLNKLELHDKYKLKLQDVKLQHCTWVLDTLFNIQQEMTALRYLNKVSS